MSVSRPTAVLCGDLNMLRCFAGAAAPRGAAPVPSVVVSPRPDDLTFRSRHCRRKHVIASARAEPERALRDLVDFGRTFADKPVLYYGDDAMLLLVSRNRAELAKYYRFLLPAPELIEDLVNKIRFNDLAERLGLPVPRTVTSNQARTADEALERLTLPCVIKPNTHIGWFKSQAVMKQGGKPRKCLRADTAGEFRDLFGRTRETTADFVVQEYVEGSDACIYSFHSFSDAEGRPLAYYAGRKIRTYPKDSGLSTYLELVREPEVVRLGLDILRKMKFVGVGKIDFKKDVKRDRFYMLEVNPRFNLWNYLGAVCGVNLPHLAYRYLVEGYAPAANGTSPAYRTGVKWLSFENDFRTFLRDYRPDGDLSWLDYLLSYRGRKVYDVFSWQDPYPAVAGLAEYARDLWGKRFGRRAVANGTQR